MIRRSPVTGVFVAGVLVAGAALATMTVGAPTASAHTEVLRAEPAPASTVTGIVDEVSLVFLDPVQPDVRIDVRDDRGASVPGLGAARLDDSATVARVGFDPLTAAGGYVVAYEFTALDGDAQSQTYRFTFRPATAPDDDGNDGLPVTTLVGLAVLAVAVVLVGVTVFLRRREESSPPVTK